VAQDIRDLFEARPCTQQATGDRVTKGVGAFSGSSHSTYLMRPSDDRLNRVTFYWLAHRLFMSQENLSLETWRTAVSQVGNDCSADVHGQRQSMSPLPLTTGYLNCRIAPVDVIKGKPSDLTASNT
jgi:hypothetical protein